MPRAGFCDQCSKNVWLTPEGSCVHGHGADHISKSFEVADAVPVEKPVVATTAGPESSDTKQCPYCAETIRTAAVKCRYCGSDLAAETAFECTGCGADVPADAAFCPKCGADFREVEQSTDKQSPPKGTGPGTQEMSGSGKRAAGYCRQCGHNVWLTESGGCFNGHPAADITTRWMAKGLVQPKTSGENGWFTSLPAAAQVLFVLLWPISFPYFIFVMWKDKKFELPVRVVLTAIMALAVVVPFSSSGQQQTGTVAEAPSRQSEAPAPVAEPESPPPVEEPASEPAVAPTPKPNPKRAVSRMTKLIEFSGDTNKQSQPFTLTGAPAKLRYSVDGGDMVGVSVYIVPAGTSLSQTGGFPVVSPDSAGSDSTYLNEEPGRYYLDVNSANCSWTVQVFQKRPVK